MGLESKQKRNIDEKLNAFLSNMNEITKPAKKTPVNNDNKKNNVLKS